MHLDRIQFLQALKIYGIEKNIPNISESIGQLLNFLIKLKHSQNVLEIGCANGYSTIWLADALEQTGGKLITGDVSKNALEQAKININQCNLNSIVTFYEGNALDFFKDATPKFDFIFIDGFKKHYHLFWQLAKQIITANALIVIDDVLKFKNKTAEFDELIKQEKDFTYCVIPDGVDDGVMLIIPNNFKFDIN